MVLRKILLSPVSDVRISEDSIGERTDCFARNQNRRQKDTLGENPNENMEDGAPTLSTEEVTNPDAASRTGEESDTPRSEKDVTLLKASKSEEEQSETSLVCKLQIPGNMCSPPALFGRVISCREPAERRTKELVLL
ncbi:hypothetical protein K1719_030928 [Acacia pycnantha]|nr:hypothetical protein K1719_030928 [Acacia pycnantha]